MNVAVVRDDERPCVRLGKVPTLPRACENILLSLSVLWDHLITTYVVNFRADIPILLCFSGLSVVVDLLASFGATTNNLRTMCVLAYKYSMKGGSIDHSHSSLRPPTPLWSICPTYQHTVLISRFYHQTQNRPKMLLTLTLLSARVTTETTPDA